MRDGYKIVVDANARTINWLVDEETRAQRLKEWEAVEHPLKVKRGVLLRYARDVQVRTSNRRAEILVLTSSAACERWGLLRLKLELLPLKISPDRKCVR